MQRVCESQSPLLKWSADNPSKYFVSKQYSVRSSPHLRMSEKLSTAIHIYDFFGRDYYKANKEKVLKQAKTVNQEALTAKNFVVMKNRALRKQ